MEIKYIINEENNTLKKFTNTKEIEMLNAILNSRFDLALECYEELNKLYPDNFDLNVIGIFLSKLYSFIADNKYVSKRDYRIIKGRVEDIIITLLMSEDFYRIVELINEYYLNVKENSLDIKQMCIIGIVNAIDILNQYNLSNIENKLNLNAGNNNISISNEYLLTNIKISLLKAMEEKYELDTNTNYYNLYLEAYKKGEFEKALYYIKLYQMKLDLTNTEKNIDYIINELNILTKKYDRNLYLNAYNNAIKQMDNKNYKIALKYLKIAFKIVPNLHLKALEGICNYNLGKVEEAYNSFVEADHYMKPEEMEIFIEILYKHGDYGDAICIYNEYSELVDTNNYRLIYIMSICAKKLGLFEEAFDFISLLELKYLENENRRVELKYERNILDKLANGEETVDYDLEDFNMYNLNHDEILIRKYLESNEMDKESFDECTVEYLFVLVKIYIDLKQIENAKNVLKLINEKIKDNKSVKYEKTLKKYIGFCSFYGI